VDQAPPQGPNEDHINWLDNQQVGFGDDGEGYFANCDNL
jgi:hypothetical protein